MPDPADKKPEAAAAHNALDADKDDGLVDLKVGELTVRLRRLDSSDGMTEAAVHWHEVVILNEYIANLRSRCWLDMPLRADRIEGAGYRVGAVLMQHLGDIDAAVLQDICNQVGEIFSDLLPYASDEAIPETPNAKATERLARIMEERRKSVAKLLRALLADAEDRAPERLDQLMNHVWTAGEISQVLDAVLG